MVDRNIFSEFGIDQDKINEEVEDALGELTEEELEQQLDESVREYSVDTVLEGEVVDIVDDDVMVDVGYKSEGIVPMREWEDPEEISVGDTVEVLLEAVEDDSGMVQLSKRKADRIRAWERIIAKHGEGDIVTGRVMRKIKGGLLVDIGVPVFLPASQVDIRRPGEIADFIGDQLTCKILKIDEGRCNIVVSRRQLIEDQREIMAARLFDKLEEGQIRSGKVKNIVDFGAFVDLGGIDGLLHITDMSWGRISHPSEMVAIDDDLLVKILNVDPERGRVALGLKQKTPSPWERVSEKYPVGSTVRGEVVNLVSYGAFVKLEEGVEGLVHVSEMSWTRRVNHPSEVVAIGDVVDVVVLGINEEKEEISLGIKQTEANPWELVAENYPPGTKVVGKVRNLTNYGAFVEIEEGIDGLLHVSDMSWTRKINHPSEVVNKSETIETVVLDVKPKEQRVALGLKQLYPDPWQEDIPKRYQAGDMVRGQISKLTSFGAFVEVEDGLEGLLHISELSEKKISSPEEIVDVGDVVDVRVIRVDPEQRKIGLSLLPMAGTESDTHKPGIVIRSEELEEAEDPDKMVEEAMEEAPQFREERENRTWPPESEEEEEEEPEGMGIPRSAAGGEEAEEEEEDTGPEGGLGIPRSVATGGTEPAEEVEETEEAEEAAEATAEAETEVEVEEPAEEEAEAVAEEPEEEALEVAEEAEEAPEAEEEEAPEAVAEEVEEVDLEEAAEEEETPETDEEQAPETLAEETEELELEAADEEEEAPESEAEEEVSEPVAEAEEAETPEASAEDEEEEEEEDEE